MNRSYRKLSRLLTFEDRFEYLKINPIDNRFAFGYDRWINQALYQSREWANTRARILIRDNGCDLGIPGREIYARPIVHHINPITIEDIEAGNICVFDANNLITTSLDTHNAIHRSNASLLTKPPIERTRGDTCPWKAY